MRSSWLAAIAFFVVSVGACGVLDRSPASSPSQSPPLSPTASPVPSRVVHSGHAPVSLGQPIELESLAGRIVTDDFDDVFAFDVDGSNLVTVAGDPVGSEFDGAWSPGGEWIVYRDSTRGINVDDEVFIARADGTEKRNLSQHPANDWGPDWSPDGSTIAFNSDRDGGIRGYLVDPDGSNLRRVEVDAWVEYPSFSPDGASIAFMGAVGSNYEVFTADLASGDVTQLTASPTRDGWPAWSPDGSTIAFTSERDDCVVLPTDQECWRGDEPGEHSDLWLIGADGTDLRRVTPESSQFVAWSPDGRYLLASGRALFVIRPDGTGRLELRADGINRALGGIPDWR